MACACVRAFVPTCNTQILFTYTNAPLHTYRQQFRIQAIIYTSTDNTDSYTNSFLHMCRHHSFIPELFHAYVIWCTDTTVSSYTNTSYTCTDITVSYRDSFLRMNNIRAAHFYKKIFLHILIHMAFSRW